MVYLRHIKISSPRLDISAGCVGIGGKHATGVSPKYQGHTITEADHIPFCRRAPYGPGMGGRHDPWKTSKLLRNLVLPKLHPS